MLRRVRRAFVLVGRSWRETRLSRVAVGKYVVLLASLLHLMWAGLLIADVGAGGSTPVAILLRIFGGPVRATVVLVAVASAAMCFPFVRYRMSAKAMAAMLLPQQTVLLMSAGAGLWATSIGHYADGVIRPWGFILADQLPVILLALLYTVAVLEVAFEPKGPGDE